MSQFLRRPTAAAKATFKPSYNCTDLHLQSSTMVSHRLSAMYRPWMDELLDWPVDTFKNTDTLHVHQLFCTEGCLVLHKLPKI